ncbi:MAG: hydrolase [Chlorobi bacterium]|nr:hydrolase [Chlorobiota bacterium]
MSNFQLLRALSFIIICVTALLRADAAVRVDTLLTMSDGVRINVVYFRPQSTQPPAGYPALVLVHGFAGSKNDYASSLAPVYADSGYFSLAYTVRGQGLDNPAYASEGEFEWFTGNRELADCREIIEWVRSRADVNRERVGIEGASQGGLTSWGAALARMPIRCAVPIIGVPYYSSILCPNKTENYFFLGALYVAKLTGKVRMAPPLGDTLYNFLAADQYESALNHVRRYDPASLAAVQVPVFMQMAWQDDLFTGREFYRGFQELTVPKKLFVWPGPHALPSGDLGLKRIELTLRFYRKWLKDDNSETIMARDSAVLLTDPATSIVHHFREDQISAFVPKSAGSADIISLYCTPDGHLSPVPAATGTNFSRLYLQNISNDALTFQSAPFSSPTVILGAGASLMVNSTGRIYQANVLLYDYDSAALTTAPITRGAYEVRLAAGESPARRNVSYDLSPQYYTIQPGHRLVASVKFGIPGFPTARPSDEFGQVAYGPQETATDTLFVGGEFSSRVDLYLAPNNGVVSVPASKSDQDVFIIGGHMVVRGESIRLRAMHGGAIDVVDIQGRLLFSRNMADGESAIETGQLPAGVYFVRHRSNGKTCSDRFIVME